MKKLITLFFVFLMFSTFAYAEEDDDIEIFGLELEKLFNLGSGILSLILLGLTSLAYKRTKNKRLLFVSIAFALFAIKGFLTSSELFFEEWELIDPVASALDFGILLSFFTGLIKK